RPSKTSRLTGWLTLPHQTSCSVSAVRTTYLSSAERPVLAPVRTTRAPLSASIPSPRASAISTNRAGRKFACTAPAPSPSKLRREPPSAIPGKYTGGSQRRQKGPRRRTAATVLRARKSAQPRARDALRGRLWPRGDRRPRSDPGKDPSRGARRRSRGRHLPRVGQVETFLGARARTIRARDRFVS